MYLLNDSKVVDCIGENYDKYT